MAAAPLLELRGVQRGFQSQEGAVATAVLQGLDLRLEAGESVAIMGPSGSGKSTLLNIIGGLDRPDSGQILFEGEDLLGLDDEALARHRNRKVGFVFQLHHLLPQCSALENVLIPTLVHDGDPAEAEQRGRRLLERVGLGARLDHKPGQLSGGERQRVAVVRALINEPRLLLADEPTGALDQASSDALATLLVELNSEEGVTLVTVTHAADLAARMGRILILHEGRLTSGGEHREDSPAT